MYSKTKTRKEAGANHLKDNALSSWENEPDSIMNSMHDSEEIMGLPLPKSLKNPSLDEQSDADSKHQKKEPKSPKKSSKLPLTAKFVKLARSLSPVPRTQKEKVTVKVDKDHLQDHRPSSSDISHRSSIFDFMGDSEEMIGPSIPSPFKVNGEKDKSLNRDENIPPNYKFARHPKSLSPAPRSREEKRKQLKKKLEESKDKKIHQNEHKKGTHDKEKRSARECDLSSTHQREVTRGRERKPRPKSLSPARKRNTNASGASRRDVIRRPKPPDEKFRKDDNSQASDAKDQSSQRHLSNKYKERSHNRKPHNTHRSSSTSVRRRRQNDKTDSLSPVRIETKRRDRGRLSARQSMHVSDSELLADFSGATENGEGSMSLLINFTTSESGDDLSVSSIDMIQGGSNSNLIQGNKQSTIPKQKDNHNKKHNKKTGDNTDDNVEIKVRARRGSVTSVASISTFNSSSKSRHSDKHRRDRRQHSKPSKKESTSQKIRRRSKSMPKESMSRAGRKNTSSRSYPRDKESSSSRTNTNHSPKRGRSMSPLRKFPTNHPRMLETDESATSKPKVAIFPKNTSRMVEDDNNRTNSELKKIPPVQTLPKKCSKK